MNIVITGTTGYVANQLAKYLNGFDKVEQVSVRNGIDGLSFEGIDCVIHCAALVHKKESQLQESDYVKVNTELTLALAERTKKEKVKHFIFLSTMAVYGNESGIINESTKLSPKTYYGKSKLLAERGLRELESDDFIVSVVRPPMIYGPSSPGNYSSLRKLAKMTPVFPFVQNQRSMLFIDHLTEFIQQLILQRDSGIFHPQDSWFMNTSLLVKEIAKKNGHSVFLSKKLGNGVLKFLGNKGIVNKVLGTLVYDRILSNYRDNSYQKYSFEEAIFISEKGTIK